MTDLFTPLLILVGLTALAVVVAYTLFAPWWTTRAGRAVFALYWTMLAIVGHFAAEAIWGQGPPWHELALLVMVEAAMIWNGYVLVSKQVLARRNHEDGH